MTSNDIPENIRSFLSEYIDSVEQLNVLFLMLKAPAHKWSITLIAQELRSTDHSIERRLNDLYDRKILIRDPKQPDLHCLSLHSKDMLVTLKELRDLFDQRSYRIVELIYLFRPR